MSRVCDSILFCIRQHQASGTVISCWYVFSYKGGDDISWLVTVRATSSSVNERMSQLSILMTFRRIRHHHLLCGMSFLTTKQCQHNVCASVAVRSLQHVHIAWHEFRKCSKTLCRLRASASDGTTSWNTSEAPSDVHMSQCPDSGSVPKLCVD